MRICIVSWDAEAHELYRLLKGHFRIDYVIERDETQWGMAECGVEIISFSKAYWLFQKKKFDVFMIPAMRGINVRTGIFARLQRGGIPADCIWYAPLPIFKDPHLPDSEKRALLCRFEERRELDYVALHVADHCNLNCAYCSVFCGLVQEPRFPNWEKTCLGLRMLKKHYDQVLVFRLLGGEPTLNPEWLDYCLYIQSLYPFADIEVVTNGTRILQMTDSQLKTMRQHSIAFDISYYPVLGKQIDAIHERLRSRNVRHYITQENEFFSRLYRFSVPGDMEQNYSVCRMKFMCLNMYEQYLCVCHALIGLERAAQFLDKDTAATIAEYKVDLTRPELDARKICSLLDRPMPICRYCSQELAKWHILPKSADLSEPVHWSLG